MSLLTPTRRRAQRRLAQGRRPHAAARAGHAGHRTAAAVRPVARRDDGSHLVLRRQGSGVVLERAAPRRAHRHALRRAGALDHGQGSAGQHAATRFRAQRFVGPACVIDVSKEVAANEDFLLMPEHVEAWEKAHGRIPKNSWVLSPHRLEQAPGRGSRFSTCAPTVRTARAFTRPRRSCWRTIATCSASASRRSAPMRARRACSIRRSRITRRCTARASSGWRVCAISISCRRPARSSSRRRSRS